MFDCNKIHAFSGKVVIHIWINRSFVFFAAIGCCILFACLFYLFFLLWGSFKVFERVRLFHINLSNDINWVGVVLGTCCPRHELSCRTHFGYQSSWLYWIWINLRTRCPGHEMLWVGIVLGVNRPYCQQRASKICIYILLKQKSELLGNSILTYMVGLTSCWRRFA